MRIDKFSWLYNKPIAHRGLHDNGVTAENSYSAYDRAIEAGYAIEIDVRFTKDGKIVVFHDDYLKRLTGAEGKVYDKTYEELLALNLQGTDEKIPLFSELLKYINGRTPLLIEVKNQPERKDLVKKTIEELKGYRGEYALQSFNPFYVRQFKKYAPDIFRGQLSSGKLDGLKKPTVYIIKHLLLNFYCKPDFISYDVHFLPIPKGKCKNKLLLSWTVRNEEEYEIAKKYADNVIFENIRP